MTLEQIVAESRELPHEVRAELVERILLAAHGEITPEVDSAWRAETRRRIAEIQEGTATGLSLENVMAEARQRTGL
ncbi:addiction module protein [Actomonas aquatica]|uniref:Addiction module protein n=1 Tax=Actomonas aquatica TaxID=2866162 RepID=A0ABZ1C3J2_9BACT|nr:addiction module protein [Opitutus sp. WL0086]WRQ86249.1 addiction module protein [Opitutus sp. WL0086]